MIMRTGITGFFESGQRIPIFAFSDFKRIVNNVVAGLGFDVSVYLESSVTTSFHAAVFETDSEPYTVVLGHSNYPIIAFSNPSILLGKPPDFVDHPSIAEKLGRLFPDVTIAESKELERRIEKSDINCLDPVEVVQVKYWQPKTIGETVFNWWA